MLLKNYTYLLFVSLFVTISYFLDNEARNMLLIGLMAPTPLLYLFSKPNKDRINSRLILFVLVLLVLNIYHLQYFRISSYVYTLCFITSFLYIRNSIDKGIFKFSTVIKIIKFLIYSFTIILILQQISILTGIPMVNPGPIYDNNPWKLSSLSPEPSLLVRYMFFFMYTYIELMDLVLPSGYNKTQLFKDKKVWVSYFWVMLSCVSTLGFILTFIIFSKFLHKKTLIQWFCVSIVLFFFLNYIFSDNHAFNRVGNLFNALATLNFSKINEADHSAAARIVPYFAFLYNFDITSIYTYIGQGMDTGKHICQEFMVLTSQDTSYTENDVNVGGIFAFIIDFGIFPISILILALQSFFKFIKNKTLVILWYAIIFMNGINMQIFWSSLIMLYLVSYFSKQKDNLKIKYANKQDLNYYSNI